MSFTNATCIHIGNDNYYIGYSPIPGTLEIYNIDSTGFNIKWNAIWPSCYAIS